MAALRITIDIFSGRPNPSFELSGHEADDVIERLKPGRRSQKGDDALPESTLGYRGLIVEQIGERAKELPQLFRVADGIIVGPRAVQYTSDPRAEDFVCGSTGPVRLTGHGLDFSRLCLEELERFRELRRRYPWPIPKWPVRPTCACAPLYEPAWWNDGGARQWSNNCYNYACDYRSDTFAQPGLAAAAMYSALTCASVRPAAIADDLIDAPNANNKCPKEGHLVALVMAPSIDFHWARRGRNGYWSHKPGGTPVTNIDNSGALIPDPRSANWGMYTDFCTFMIVMHGHIKIR